MGTGWRSPSQSEVQQSGENGDPHTVQSHVGVGSADVIVLDDEHEPFAQQAGEHASQKSSLQLHVGLAGQTVAVVGVGVGAVEVPPLM